MKRIAVLALCIALLGVFAGCGSGNVEIELKDGTYFLDGDYQEFLTPYLWLHPEDQTFHHGAGTIFSYAERGSYVIEGNQLIATSQNTIIVFEIQDENTLVVVNNGDSEAFRPPMDGKFVYSGN